MILREQMPPGHNEVGRRRIAAGARSGAKEMAPRQGGRIARRGCLSFPTRAGGCPLVLGGAKAARSGALASNAGLWERVRAWGAGRSAVSPSIAREGG